MNHQDMNAAQFAKICNTQKSTLLFYDKEGLLKPKSVLDNGYRCYDFEQYYDYELICLLKDTGASLKEIKRYINNMDGQEFLDFLMLRHQQVKLDIKNLTDRKHMLEDMISTVKEASSATYDKISIEQCQREEYEILKCGDDSDPDENFKAYMEREASLKEKSRAPYGVIYDAKKIKEGCIKELAHFNKIRKETLKENVHIKEAGTYAVFIHHGTYESHNQVMTDFLNQVEKLGMTIKSDLYMSDMMRLVKIDDTFIFSQKYAVRVQ
jgi:DNA-binding transcriptional MerR regulator